MWARSSVFSRLTPNIQYRISWAAPCLTWFYSVWDNSIMSVACLAWPYNAWHDLAMVVTCLNYHKVSDMVLPRLFHVWHDYSGWYGPAKSVPCLTWGYSASVIWDLRSVCPSVWHDSTVSGMILPVRSHAWYDLQCLTWPSQGCLMTLQWLTGPYPAWLPHVWYESTVSDMTV